MTKALKYLFNWHSLLHHIKYSMKKKREKREKQKEKEERKKKRKKEKENRKIPQLVMISKRTSLNATTPMGLDSSSTT